MKNSLVLIALLSLLGFQSGCHEKKRDPASQQHHTQTRETDMNSNANGHLSPDTYPSEAPVVREKID